MACFCDKCWREYEERRRLRELETPKINILSILEAIGKRSLSASEGERAIILHYLWMLEAALERWNQGKDKS